MNKNELNRITVLLLEANKATFYECGIEGSGSVDVGPSDTWDPSKSLVDRNGDRLWDEIFRRITQFWSSPSVASFRNSNEHMSDALLISLPGTLEGHKTLTSSSRLGIREKVDAAAKMEQRLQIPCYFFHDVECLAIGEDIYGEPSLQLGDENKGNVLAYIFADEGIGSKFIIDGSVYAGAGLAGSLGRLVVEPDGSYFRALRARGPLEAYSSRPLVSERLVETYHSERNKSGFSNDVAENSKFRQALRVASDGDWTKVTYKRMAEGIENGDPIALSVVDTATRYLGFGINAVLAILHPNRIVLGGSMMTELPGFADKVIHYVRQYSWPLAWNNVDISLSGLGRKAQVLGAMEVWARNYRNS